MNSDGKETKQWQQHWKAKYEEAKHLLEDIEDFKLFVGFNMNVDFIYKPKAERLGRLTSEESTKHRLELKRDYQLQTVEDFTDFLAAFSRALAGSGPQEVDLGNKQIRDKIKERFEPRKRSIGGQAGIISNFLAGLGADTIVYTSVLSPQQLDYLHQDLLYPRVVQGELVLDRITNCPNASDTKNNLVFEYEEGFKVPNLEINAVKDGRFILSDYLEDFSVLLPPELLNKSKSLFKSVDRAIVSGYHDLAGKNFYARLQRSGQQLDKIKRANQDLAIHLELAAQKNKDLEREIISNVACKVDSIGFDASELPQALRALGEIQQAAEVEGSSASLHQIWRALKAIVRELELKRCQLHCDKYLVCLVREGYEVDPDKLRDSLLLGGNSAVAKASQGSIPDKQAILSDYASRISESGLEEMIEFREKLELPENFLRQGIHQFESQGLTLVVVPTLLAEETKTLVGLGDVISAASFAGELF